MTKQLLAPNRKPSNLNAMQYELVRTLEFKKWFGDWEKLALTKFYDAGIDEVTLSKLESNVSKVVDENGEPLAVYHGTTKDFNVFLDGSYFTDDYMNADGYASGEIVLETFLNIKNPFIINAKGRKWNNLKSKYGTSTREIVSNINYKKFDGVIFNNINDNWFDDEIGEPQNVYFTINPNQIKLADGTNIKFDSNNLDIRFEQGGDIDYSNYKTAVIALFNENKVLILKRGSTANWMPNKWSLVGGIVENNENPKKAVIRETFEEIGLIPKNIVFDKNIKDKRLGNIYYYYGSLESTKVNLDYENSDYAFISKSEIDNYDYVPHVKNYIKKLFENNVNIKFYKGGATESIIPDYLKMFLEK
jgi:8-oxo-dGTP pyrophosphatase MutT (NUDIX family)